MKISKLFHWLYAFLMFLPIVLFIPNALYYGFNEHATNSETTTINYKYQSNEVNTQDDLIVGNIYHLNINNSTIDEMLSDTEFYINVLHVYNYDFSAYGIDFVEYLQMDNNNSGNINIEFDFQSDFSLTIYVYLIDNYSLDSLVTLTLSDTLDTENFILDCDFQLRYLSGYINPTFISYTDYNVIESVEINTNDTISNKMYQAWQSTWNLPLLSWTHDTFVAAPFTYITGLFGIGSDNTLNYIFAYFVSISICWLVFDLIMYVPNLAHRWLDKGALE